MSLNLIFTTQNFYHEKLNIAIVMFLFSTSICAQKKSKYNTIDKNISKHETRWDGSISYGNTIFIGDLSKTSTTKYLPNVALAIKFNKEYNPETSLQLSIITGKNSGENAPTSANIASINFRSQYTQGYIAYRKAITSNWHSNSSITSSCWNWILLC